MSRTAAPDTTYTQSRLLAEQRKTKSVTLELPPFHQRQYEFLTLLDTPGVRFAVGACGTKFGKTWGTTGAITKRAWDNRDSVNWWISPTFDQAKMAMALVERMLPQGAYREYKADMRLVLLHPDGSERSEIAFKSADNEDSLRGYGVNFFVMDEAARCKYESFISLMTTVTQTMGCGYFISTPKGRNWFYDVYQWGEKFDSDGHPLYEPGHDPHPDFISIRMPTWTNPHVPLDSIQSMKRNMPEDVFQQEVGAQFLLDSAGVFKGIRECIKGELQPPMAGASYVMGVDLARLKDYSVLTVEDRSTRHIVHFERFNQISWEVQYHKIIETAKRYNNAVVCIDSTGIGDPIVENIQNSGVRVVPYKITGSAAKQQLIDKLRVNIEKQRLTFPLITVLKRELENYEYQVSSSNVVKFSAPAGQHDDCVISLALCNWSCDQAEWRYSYRQVRGV